MASLLEDRLSVGDADCQRRNKSKVAAFAACAGLVLALGGSALSARALADEAQLTAAASEAAAYGTTVTKGWTQVDSCEWRSTSPGA